MLASKTWCFLEEVNFQAGFVGEENLVAVRVFGAKQVSAHCDVSGYRSGHRGKTPVTASVCRM